jgi:hypothetical protein
MDIYSKIHNIPVAARRRPVALASLLRPVKQYEKQVMRNLRE